MIGSSDRLPLLTDSRPFRTRRGSSHLIVVYKAGIAFAHGHLARW